MYIKLTLVLVIIVSKILGLNFNNQYDFLNEDDQSIVFAILTHVRNKEDNLLWQRSYDSIRKFYPDVHIVIINDNSLRSLSKHKLDNVSFIDSSYPGAGELLPYYYFLKYQWADKLIFLHDSMFLRRAFTDQELNHPIKFHWHFDYNAGKWDQKFDLIDELVKHLYRSEEIMQYYKSHVKEWRGCFGVTSIIDLNVLQEIERKYGLTENLKSVINSREQRMALERIFGILVCKEKFLRPAECSNFGLIKVYPNAFKPNITKRDLEKTISNYPGAIVKVWKGR